MSQSEALAALLQRLENLMYSDPEEALRDLPPALAQAQAQGDRTAHATALMIGGVCELQMGHLERAFELAHSGSELVSDSDEHLLRGRLLNMMALSKMRPQSYQEALNHFSEALKYARLAGDDSFIVKVLNNIAGLYGELEYNTRALEIYEEIIDICRGKTDDPTFTEVFLAAHIASANLHNHRGNYAYALEHFGLFEGKRLSFPVFSILMTLEVADSLQNMGEPRKALEAIESIREQVSELHLQGLTSRMLSKLGQIYVRLGDPQQATAYLEKSLEKGLGKPDRLYVNSGYSTVTYRTLAELYEQQGDYRKALGYSQQALKAAREPLERDLDLALERTDTHVQIDLLRQDADAERQKNAKLEQLNRELTEAQETLAYQASHDSLTGILNRLYFQEHARQLLGARPAEQEIALLLIDLDRFKAINENWGHQAGDRLLRAVTARLERLAQCWPGAALGRIGGDEFTLLLPLTPEQLDVHTVAACVLAELERPFEMAGGQQFTLHASLGYAVAPRDGGTIEEIQDNADLARRFAKKCGGGQALACGPELQAQYQRRQRLDRELQGALERGEFRLVYQGRYGIGGGALVGFEALLRWDSRLGAVSPAEFIPLAEENRFILPLGEWVLRQACQQAVIWNFAARGLCVSVNVSALQLDSFQFALRVRQILEETGLPGHCLILELTESTILRDVDKGIEVVCALRELGVRIALDDFGVGYSSLSILRDLPIDDLKLDRTFLRSQSRVGPPSAARPEQGGQPDERGPARLFLHLIIELARALNLQVTAEGVEEPEQLALLQDLRCDHVQGYLLGRPLEVAAAAALLGEGP